MSIEDNMSLEGITKRQQQICETALKENRGFTEEEKKEMDHWDEVYKRNHESLNNGAIRPIPLGQSQKIEAAAQRSKTMNQKTEHAYLLTPEAREYCNYVLTGKTESRTLQKDSDVYGGFISVPETVVKTILQGLDNAVWIRQLATKYTVASDTVGIPTLGSDVSDPDFTGEISEAQLDTTMDFLKRSLTPHRLTKALKWSRTLAAIGAVNVAAYIQSRLVYKLAVTEEASFMTGDGSGKPLGLFTTSDSGVDSSRNVSTGNTTTEVKADNLIEVLYNLKSQYVADPSCRWIFHRTVLKGIKKLKLGDGSYIFDIDSAGIPRILGVPVIQSEYCPSTMTSGSRVGIVGAMRFYGVASNDELRVQTLVEKYALENCSATLISEWIDGSPLLAEAFSVVTLA